MSTQKAKFALFSRLQALGFTYEEAAQLRRIEMTLQRWAEAECNGEIQRDEATNRPFRQISGGQFSRGPASTYIIADREAGALRRLKAIVDARNERIAEDDMMSSLDYLFPYHQSDPRGCALYLVKRSALPDTTDEEMRRHSGEWPLKSAETRTQWKLSCYYNRGVAVCA